MELVNIAKKNLVDEAHSQIKQMIVNGVWKEGESLPSENKLCGDLGVSRVVVREVLQRLRAEKLIVTRQGVGSFVSNPNNFEPFTEDGQEPIQLTEQEFLAVMEFRRIMEFPILELAVQRGNQEDFALISQALEGMERAVGDAEAFSVEDYKFHTALAKAAHNEMFCKAMESCQKELYSCFYQMNRVKDVHSWGIEMHRAVFDAVVRRDAKGAVSALKKASDYNYARLSKLFTGKKD